MSIYDYNDINSQRDDEDANSFDSNHSYESDEEILIQRSSSYDRRIISSEDLRTAGLYQRRSMNQELHHQHSSRNTRGAITYNSQDSFRHEEDAYSLYSNSENDINYRLSSIARSEELHIQQTLISYNPRLTSALRNVEAAAAEWRLRYELVRLENQDMQNRAAEAEANELRRIYEMERWENQAFQRRVVEAEADEWRRRCELERLENKELQRKAAEAKVAEWQRKYESARSTNKQLQQKAAEAETAKWKQKYEAERCRSQEAKHKGICTLSSRDLAYSLADEAESSEPKPKDESERDWYQDLEDKAELAERKREENHDLQHKATKAEAAEPERDQKKVSPGLFHYAFVCLIESLMMVVAYLVTNFLIGLTTGAGFIGIIMMYSGDFHLLHDLPKIFCHYTVSYVIFGFWPVQRGYKSDLVEDYGVMDWRDLTATTLAIFLCSRILYYVALTLKEIVQMIYKTIRAKFYFNVQFSWR